jgi:hypothetical protein
MGHANAMKQAFGNKIKQPRQQQLEQQFYGRIPVEYVCIESDST